MGLYDNVYCDMPLPDGYEGYFQTKSLQDPYLRAFLITKEGRLHQLSQKDACEETHDLDFHGILNFYDYNDDNEWHEYNAKFTDGQCVEIKVVCGEPQGE